MALAVPVVFGPQSTGNAATKGAASVATGKKIYDAQCASCHGGKLEGQANWRERLPSGRLPAPPHDETGHTWHHPDAFLLAITKFGVGAFAPKGYESDMPAFEKNLNDDEIKAVIEYIKSTWPPAVRQRQEQISRKRR